MKTALKKFISESGAFMLERVKIIITVTHLLRPKCLTEPLFTFRTNLAERINAICTRGHN